ncbi:MAG TPA: epoxyalkane--coenzyme M transferase, partial [Chloroflexota bacterium]
MKRSSGRFLTTPTGSLPRPDELAEMLFEDCAGTLTDRAGLESRVASAVAEAVRRQAELGLDVIGDGEMSKISYATYVTQRLSGFDAAVESPRPVWPDMADFPTFAKRYLEQSAASPRVKLRTCTGEVRYVGHAALEQDMTNLQAALTDLDVEEVFVTAASPGLIAFFHRNHFYKEYDDYVWALA